MSIEQFILDVETLGTSDASIVLSAAFLHFNVTEDETYEQMVEKTLYIKFDVAEQKEKGRKADKKTLEWWQKQPEYVRSLCLTPSKKDVTVADGIKQIKDYINKYAKKEFFVWARGSLDQRVMENLCQTFELEPIADYNMFMDVRTAIRMTKETSNIRGYCELPEQFKHIQMQAHNPIDDVIRDVLMLKYGL